MAEHEESLDAGYAPDYEMLPATGTDGGAAALRQVASERLAAHRRKKAMADAEQRAVEAEAVARQVQRRGGASRVREAVAARYQSSVSYHEFLAQEAERALMQAQAEAEVAARNAEAMAEAQMKLLEELEQWKKDAEPPALTLVQQEEEVQARGDFASALADIIEAATEAMHLTPMVMERAEEPVAEASTDAAATFGAAAAAPSSGLTVRLYEELAPLPPSLSKLSRRTGSRQVVAEEDVDHSHLDEEIEFRRAPEFLEMLPPEPVVVSGNLIEFPRQLVATRKARPRIAEGPLREDGSAEPQLRIFEVEAETVKAAVAEVTAAPEWQSILLEHAVAIDPVENAIVQPQFALQPLTAPTPLRAMALVVDGCAVSAAFLAFVAALGQLAGPALKAMPIPVAAASGLAVLLLFAVCYQVLFFTFAEATPGMRYARIGLCTFSDSNPSRRAMRRRVLATLLAACPLGLGLLWACMDEDGLGWHDRMSRMYPRAY